MNEQKVFDKLIEMVARWQSNFYLFVTEGLGLDGRGGIKPSTQQRQGCEEISKLVNAKRKKNIAHEELSQEEQEYYEKIGISIMSGQGPGKDAMVAWAVIWMLFCYREVLIPCTAPSADQLKNILWAEITRWLNRIDENGEPCVLEIIRESIAVQSEKIFHTGYGGKVNFAFSKTANPGDDPEKQAKTLYGLHEKYMMVVCEEAAGIPEAVFKPLEGTLTRECNFTILVFNPIYRTGFAIESQTGTFAHKFINLQWNAEDSEVVNPQHIKDMAEKYGTNSNTYRTLVKGLPPLAEDDTIISYDWVQAAAQREIVPFPDDPRIGGLDPGAGGDNSVFTFRHGWKVHKQQVHSSPDTMQLVAWACRQYDECDLDILAVDVIGIGKGVYDRMKELGYNVMPVDVKNKAIDDEIYRNKRSELWFKARDIFQDNGIDIPDDMTLKAELWSPKFKNAEKGQRKREVESKYDMKKRLAQSRSPNNADSLLLTLAVNDAMYRRASKQRREDESDYDEESAYYERKRNKYSHQSGSGWMTA